MAIGSLTPDEVSWYGPLSSSTKPTVLARWSLWCVGHWVEGNKSLHTFTFTVHHTCNFEKKKLDPCVLCASGTAWCTAWCMVHGALPQALHGVVCLRHCLHGARPSSGRKEKRWYSVQPTCLSCIASLNVSLHHH